MISPFIVFGQSYTIDNHFLIGAGLSSDYDIAQNTYYNTTDSCNIEWEIVTDSLPVGWDMSFCFPNCYPSGIVSAQSLILPNEQVYLNAHVYPYGVAGEGIIEMKITTNSTDVDTIKWHFTASGITSINNIVQTNHSDEYEIYDIQGRKVDNIKPGMTLILKYRDNSIKTKMIYVL